MFELAAETEVPSSEVHGTAWLLPSTLHLEAARPGAAAHMSLHQNHNVKERQRPTHRLTPFSRGDLCAWFLVPAVAFRVEHRVGGVASMLDLQIGQQPFCIFVSNPLKPAEICRLRGINR
ncbi:hypothetical protein [Sphingomonas koreensis]